MQLDVEAPHSGIATDYSQIYVLRKVKIWSVVDIIQVTGFNIFTVAGTYVQ